MPFQMRVQPVNAKTAVTSPPATVGKLAGKTSRLKRLFERQFPGVLRLSSAEKLSGGGRDGRDQREKEEVVDGAATLEPSSVCLDKMVQSFMEDTSGERPVRCGRNRCNCFHGSCTDSDDDDIDLQFFTPAADHPPAPLAGDASELLKGFVPCGSIAERNLLADASNIVEKNKLSKGKLDCQKILADELQLLGYDASVCKSRWDKTSSHPAGEYEYVDVLVDGGDRLLVDVEFRSEFEIARSTKAYRAVLQSLPLIFVGKPDRLRQIVVIVCESARQSLKKKGLSFPPWRKPEYMRAKWLAPYTRADAPKFETAEQIIDRTVEKVDSISPGEIAAVDKDEEVMWQPPAVRPRNGTPGAKVVTGLASVLND